MGEAKPLILRFFRKKPGDIGAKDLPVDRHDMGAAKQLAEDMLLKLFSDDRKKSDEKPLQCELVERNGTVVLRLRVNFNRQIEESSDYSYDSEH